MYSTESKKFNFSKISEAYNKLQDEESREQFNIRAEYAIYHDTNDFINKISRHAHGCRMSSVFEEKYKKSQGIIVYGCGQEGTIAKRAIEACGYSVNFFCDRRVPESEMIDGKRVISINKAINNPDLFTVVP